ncbi:MAG: flagellin [Bdellovibrionota bacterium]
MGLRIKTNVEALKAQRNLSNNNRMLQQSMERLSSGQRINRSADDAAGLAVSERIRARIGSLNVVKRNANDAISYIQVAEGGLNETTNILVRMRGLASQAASDTIGNRERSFLNKEFQELKAEVARIVKSTEFNGSKVLYVEEGEEPSPLQIFVGSSNKADQTEEVDPSEDPDILTINFKSLVNLSESLSQIADDTMRVVPDIDDLTTGGATDLGGEGNTNTLFKVLDQSLNAIAEYRATLGSVQSRLNSTITNAEISGENLAAARSRISDVDYATESANFAQARILTQAGLSVQAQANAYPEMALSLIRG